MTLVDTSIWIDHFKHKNSALISLLEDNQVLTHPFIVGEVYIGHLKNRKDVLGLLQYLPMASLVNDQELIDFIAYHKLYGKGLGWIDLHLLASCLLSKCELLSSDKKLMSAWQQARSWAKA